MTHFTFHTDANAKEKLKGLLLGYIQFEEVKNVKTNEVTDSVMEATCTAIKNKFPTPESILEDAVVNASRQLYLNIGRDPTKERPSGEALVRRVVKGKGIYRINTVVDINNVISLLSGFPCGVYDSAKIEGEEITLLLGGPELTYEGLGGRMVEGERRILTADSGSVFGGPTADSARTQVTTESKEILMLIYSPPGIEEVILRAVLEKAALLMERATGGRKTSAGIYAVE